MKRINLKFNLPVIVLKEGERFVAYMPALDLSTSGRNFEETKKRFVEAVLIFFEEIIAKRTIDDVLSEFGWQKTNQEWMPPIIISQQPETIRISAMA